ncbi:MAG: hypothetical protein H0U34_00930 [Sphingomonas sp.]|nr:hypothetical protein [Sphingomonas sp.]
MVDGDRDRERDTEHTTIIERDGGDRGGGGVLAIVLLIIVVLVLLWVFREQLGMSGGDTTVDVPEQIDVTVN